MAYWLAGEAVEEGLAGRAKGLDDDGQLVDAAPPGEERGAGEQLRHHAAHRPHIHLGRHMQYTCTCTIEYKRTTKHDLNYG